MYEGFYRADLVIFSVLFAIFAAHTALSMAGRVASSESSGGMWWLFGGAAAMGIGIWSMHFIGMLSFRLPIPVGYDLGITILSLILPIAVSAIALWQVSRPRLPPRALLYGSLLMGIGINAMHYTGMAAMRMSPDIQYSIPLVILSIGIAVAASGTALWLAFKLRSNESSIWKARLAAAVVMGFAIAGMHYTGMAAANFPVGSICRAATEGFSQNSLAVMVIIGTLAILTVATMASMYDAQLETRSLLLAETRAQSESRQEMLIYEREARSQAEQMSAMKDEFLSVVSHELRTPLSAIVGWAQIIRKGNVSEAVLHKGIETIERNAKAQAKLIDDLLDMSKIVSGKVILDKSRVDLVNQAEHVIASFRPAALEKGITLKRELDSDLPSIHADPVRLQQILANLLSNAIKFTPSGGTITLRVLRGGEQVVIAVQDSGIGIAADFLPHVFERFRQADAKTTRKYGGMGLGLSIVKSLVLLHGGTITVESEGEGRGATFRLSLPVARFTPLPPSTGQDRPPHERRGAPPVSLRGVSVLVVEDAVDTRQLLVHLLTSAGASVEDVDNAADALRYLDAHLPHAIVSDIGLPEMDGYEFIRAVRHRSALKGGTIPALALTAFARPDDRDRALQSGFNSFLEKPFEQAELLQRIAVLCARY